MSSSTIRGGNGNGPRSGSLYIAISVFAISTFVADLFTPLGLATWILYIIPLALTLFSRRSLLPPMVALVVTILMLVTLVTDQPGITPWVAHVNRLCGLAVLWTIAFLARVAILNRSRVEADEWIRSHQTRLLEQMQGDEPLREIGARVLDVVSAALNAPVAALYAGGGADLPGVFRSGEGLVGEAARTGALSVLRDIPEGFFPIRSALVNGPPRHLVVCPLNADGVTHGVLELGLVHPPAARGLELLDRGRGAVAIAIRSAFYRDRLQVLLEETRRQAEELHTQQMELKAANEELEEQSRALQASQARLEEQQADLEATNAQLESRSLDLEYEKQASIAARQEAERASEYKSEFLANMSHEVRTPLNSALILAKLLSENRSGRLSEQEVQYAETIHSAGSSLLALLNDILDLAKIEAGAVEVQPGPVALSKVMEKVRRTFGPIANDKGLAFRAELAEGAPETIVSDGQRLQQVLTNLVSNAIKFTDSGEVVVGVGPAVSGGVELRVRDTGIGIPSDKLDVIFQAFRQLDGSTHRKYGGTGLGLSISLELARLLGGDIRVESAPGSGSTFTLVLPQSLEARSGRRRARDPMPPAQGAAADPRVPTPETALIPAGAGVIADDRNSRRRPGRLILVIEDDIAFARILYDLAHELDFDCVVATSNDEGMALARDMAPSGILLDVGLPDGSGLALLDRLKRNPDTRHIPVHVVSVADHAQEALGLGAVGYVLKPVPRDELIKAVQKLQDRALGLFRDSLAPRGFLGLGAREGLGSCGHAAGFEELVRAERIYRRTA